MHRFKNSDDLVGSLRELCDLGAEIHTADWKQICVMLSSAARKIEQLQAETRTLRNVGISQMDQINRLLAQQTNS